MKRQKYSQQHNIVKSEQSIQRKLENIKQKKMLERGATMFEEHDASKEQDEEKLKTDIDQFFNLTDTSGDNLISWDEM